MFIESYRHKTQRRLGTCRIRFDRNVSCRERHKRHVS